MPRIYSQSVFIGDLFETKHAGKVQVIGYCNSRNVTIQFNDGITKIVSAHNLIKGEVGNEYAPKSNGKGFIGIGKFLPYNKDRTPTKEYAAWKGMFRRCYDKNFLSRQPTYEGCTVCEEWYNFQNFAEWYVSQNGAEEGFELDKDLKILGNKEYSPMACSLLPLEINNLFANSKANRGIWPIGVYWNKRDKKFVARLGYKNKYKILGKFDCPNEAFDAYKYAKERHIKDMATLYKDLIPESVYTNIINHKVQITD